MNVRSMILDVCECRNKHSKPFNCLGLTEELGTQKASYEEKLDALEKKLEEATAGDKIAKKDDLQKMMADFEERLKSSEGNTIQR